MSVNRASSLDEQMCYGVTCHLFFILQGKRVIFLHTYVNTGMRHMKYKKSDNIPGEKLECASLMSIKIQTRKQKAFRKMFKKLRKNILNRRIILKWTFWKCGGGMDLIDLAQNRDRDK